MLPVIPLIVMRLVRRGEAAKNNEKVAARIKLEAAAPPPKKPRSGGNVKLKG